MQCKLCNEPRMRRTLNLTVQFNLYMSLGSYQPDPAACRRWRSAAWSPAIGIMYLYVKLMRRR